MKTLHDMKDIVDIYYSTTDGKITYDYDNANIVIWQPDEQRHMELSFSGSVRPTENEKGQINFLATYKDNIGDNCVLNAFNCIIDEIIDSKFDMSINWQDKFISKLVELRKKK